jgi:hypothetical protein
LLIAGVCVHLYPLGSGCHQDVAVTGDDDAQVIPPLEAFWAGARAAGRPRLWFRDYRGEDRCRLLAGRAGEFLTWESTARVGSEQAAGLVPGALR